MSDREGKAFHRLRDRICRPSDRCERIENGILAGMPDVNYCMSGIEGWIEIKCPKEPVKPTTSLFASNHKVEIEQSNWMLKQHNAGGLSWLFILTEKRIMLLPGSWVGLNPSAVNELSAHELERKSVWKTGLPVLDPLRWADLREILTGGKG